MIHVVTSEGAARALKRASLPGEIVIWRDRLDEGPVSGPVMQAEWLRSRGAYWESATRGQVTQDVVLSALEASAGAVERGLAEGGIVLWADAGLADQLALVCWLQYIASFLGASARCEFVTSGERAGGRLCGLSDLIPSQIKALFETRRGVSSAVMSAACRTWGAFCDSNPSALLKLIAEDLSPLPHLKAALVRHLQQFPDVTRGLSRLEYETLAVTAMGYTKLVEIFVHVDQHEDRPHFNDTALWRCVDRLAREKHPLVSVAGSDALPLWDSPRRLLDWTVWITDAGLEVLHGIKDRVRMNGFERQLGGVRFSGNHARWRWDSERGVLVCVDEVN